MRAPSAAKSPVCRAMTRRCWVSAKRWRPLREERLERRATCALPPLARAGVAVAVLRLHADRGAPAVDAPGVRGRLADRRIPRTGATVRDGTPGAGRDR